MIAILIGGPAHGQQVEVAEGVVRVEWDVTEYQREALAINDGVGEVQRVQYVSYTRRSIVAEYLHPDAVPLEVVFALVSLTDEDVRELL